MVLLPDLESRAKYVAEMMITSSKVKAEQAVGVEQAVTAWCKRAFMKKKYKLGHIVNSHVTFFRARDSVMSESEYGQDCGLQEVSIKQTMSQKYKIGLCTGTRYYRFTGIHQSIFNTMYHFYNM